MTRFTSFVLLATLAGTPAAAAVCAAMCLPGAFHHTMSAPPAAGGSHESARAASSHEHDESEEAATASAAASMDDAWEMPLRVSASAHECCPTADNSLQARYRAQRSDESTALSISAAALARAAVLPAFVSFRSPPDVTPPGAYSPRSHAPLVLRI